MTILVIAKGLFPGCTVSLIQKDNILPIIKGLLLSSLSVKPILPGLLIRSSPKIDLAFLDAGIRLIASEIFYFVGVGHMVNLFKLIACFH